MPNVLHFPPDLPPGAEPNSGFRRQPGQISALLIRVLPRRRKAALEPGPVELAAVRGGERAAVLTALSAMAARGEVEVAARGGIRRGDVLGPDAHALEHALRNDLYTRTSPAELVLRPRTSRAVSAVASDVAAAVGGDGDGGGSW